MQPRNRPISLRRWWISIIVLIVWRLCIWYRWEVAHIPAGIWSCISGIMQFFAGKNTREAIKEGRADYTPCYFFEVPKLMATSLKPDVAVISVTKPNEEGYCSLGVSVDYTMAAAKEAATVIAQVNEHMPFTAGNSMIHVSDVDCFVEAHQPIHELAPPSIGETEMAIAKHCASLIEDGDTLQLGIGAIPDAVLKCLADKRDLGIHSEMISDGVVEMVEAGVITNRKKSSHKGKIISTFLMGTKRLYDFVDGNPDVEMHPVDYVNNPYEIMKNDNLVSINSCVQVDFMGQVAAESIGAMQISGVGGQVDFVRGASLSRNGRSIIAMPSTAKNGKVSRIVPNLDHGCAVTTPRNDVDYIITEHGIAHLKGKSLRERAKALIEIADPEFRHELIAAYNRRFRKAGMTPSETVCV